MSSFRWPHNSRITVLLQFNLKKKNRQSHDHGSIDAPRNLKNLWLICTIGMHQYVILATEIEARWVDADLCMNNSGPSRGYCVCCRHKHGWSLGRFSLPTKALVFSVHFGEKNMGKGIAKEQKVQCVGVTVGISNQGQKIIWHPLSCLHRVFSSWCAVKTSLTGRFYSSKASSLLGMYCRIPFPFCLSWHFRLVKNIGEF